MHDKPATSPEEIERLRRAIAACERGVSDRGGAMLSSDGAPSRRPWSAQDRLPTGFDALDEALDGGLHRGALNEIYTAASGSGALEALLPAIVRAGAPKTLLVWIHPTSLPYPPALVQAGCDLRRWLIVRPPSDEDHLWALDLVLKSRAGAATIACLGDLHDRGIRRLQLSARDGGGVVVLLRPAALACRPSPAPVRIFAEPKPAADPGSRRVLMTVMRCRGVALADVSVVLEWSRDPLDVRSSSWVADRARGAGRSGSKPPPSRTRSA